MTKPFFTIGHSTRAIEEFVDLFREADVQVVVDVRSIPRSRTNPLYNRETFPEALSAYQIDYVYVAALGGRRGKSRDVPPLVNAFWEHQSFHNYADYALTDAFQAGLVELRRSGHARRCAIMCAEGWRCHRRNHCGLFNRDGRGRVAHPWSKPHRACQYDRRGELAGRWDVDLSG
jgi:uncharacterized protein (DUF488 family)